MKVCYVDEAGCTGQLPNATSPIQPVLVFSGLILDIRQLRDVTEKLIQKKQTYFPNLAPRGTTHMGWILREVKGADLRKEACDTNRNVRRHRLRYLDETLKIIENHGGKLTGRVWVKGIGQPINGDSIYTYSIQSIYRDFQNYLETVGDTGMVIVDSRLKHLNSRVAHSVFTQKFKQSGDAFDRIIELPAFSHSENHAGLQLTDTICSAIITPMAVHTYCVGHVNNLHVRAEYAKIKTKFSGRCCALQHRYIDSSTGRDKGGFTVSDGIQQRNGGAMFR
jgi:hypothetical protein